MSIAKKYTRRVKQNLALEAVWLPGTDIELGDILQRNDGILGKIANIDDFGISFETETVIRNATLDFQAQGVRTRVMQAGAEVSPYNIDMNVEASLNIEFNKEETYYIKTPQFDGIGISNLIRLGNHIKGIGSWQHRRYFVVTNVFAVSEFVFLGSTARDRSVEIQGSGEAITNYLETGFSTDLNFSGLQNIEIRITGQSGAVTMRVSRFRRNGKVWK
ncbi:MAG: hypothetical protein U9R60_18395 [Bacteroidota bacterium]|nr:hypothetical protein [Bacteroidota bacterium]